MNRLVKSLISVIIAASPGQMGWFLTKAARLTFGRTHMAVGTTFRRRHWFEDHPPLARNFPLWYGTSCAVLPPVGFAT